MRPSEFRNYPWNSISQKAESEVVAQNIMIILKRTGNEFRTMNFEDYKSERLKDGNFTDSEKKYFDEVIKYCRDSKSALLFCSVWANKS